MLQDLPSWVASSAQPPGTTRSFWAAHGGVQPPADLLEDDPHQDWPPTQEVESPQARLMSHLSRPSPFTGTYYPPASDGGSETGSAWINEPTARGASGLLQRTSPSSDTAAGPAAAIGYLPILEGVQQAIGNMLRLPFVWGSEPEVSDAVLQPDAAPARLLENGQENQAPNAVPSEPPILPAPLPPKPPVGPNGVEVTATAQSADANLCKVMHLLQHHESPNSELLRAALRLLQVQDEWGLLHVCCSRANAAVHRVLEEYGS